MRFVVVPAFYKNRSFQNDLSVQIKLICAFFWDWKRGFKLDTAAVNDSAGLAVLRPAGFGLKILKILKFWQPVQICFFLAVAKFWKWRWVLAVFKLLLPPRLQYCYFFRFLWFPIIYFVLFHSGNGSDTITPHPCQNIGFSWGIGLFKAICVLGYYIFL